MMDIGMMDPAPGAMAVAPGPEDDKAKSSSAPRDAGADSSILERLARNPDSREARLDRALDESMDASDPPASIQPGHGDEPPESSGYDEKAERRLAAEGRGLIGRILSRIGLG